MRLIDVLRNEVACVQRRAENKCNGGSDCCTCDLVMQDNDITSALQAAIQALEIEPVKHGRWEWKEGKLFCSVCKKQGEPKYHYEDGMVEEYDYCPNCGAKMGGEVENG